MEVFSFLKFRRSSSASGSSSTTTITSSASDALNQALEADDEGSFFDLIFAAPDCDIRRRRNRNFEEEDNSSRDVGINSSDNDEDSCNNLSKKDGVTRSNYVESPNDVFYKRKISPIEDTSKTLSPISLLRSPQKFKVLILGFKKSKLEKTEMNNQCEAEEFPISSLFTRDKSLRSQLNNERFEESSTSCRSKQFSKDVVHKYLNLIKPLYVRVSKRYNARTKFSNQFRTVSPLSSPATAPSCSPKKQVEDKQGSRVTVFREVCKSLVKSRSTSSAVGIMPISASRRDDSVVQQQDGIQSAILHCKRSYSSSSSSRDYSTLSRSVSSCSQEKSVYESPQKRSSI